MLSFEKNKLEKKLSNLKIRRSMDSEARQKYKKKRLQVYELNKRAAETKTDASFGLPSNGNIWKYCKISSGSWKRDKFWSEVDTIAAKND